MDFYDLLSVADKNRNKAQYEASITTYNSDLPPPKKVPKSKVTPDKIKRYLDKLSAEKAAKDEEDRKRKENLLALRAQSTKNSKKASLMASRTKDNDFSKIKLTEDEIEAKRKREAELKKNLFDKVERMKARIEMEEKEKLLPRKRKRKHKNGEIQQGVEESVVDNNCEDQCNESSFDSSKISDKNRPEKKKNIRKPKPQAPALSFAELLKVAENKQFEPIELVPKVKKEDRPMSRKERKLLEMEQDRIRRKEERMKSGVKKSISKPTSSVQNSDKKIVSNKNYKPVVIHVEKQTQEPTSKFKVPVGTAINNHANKSSKNFDVKSNSFKSTNKTFPNTSEKSVKLKDINNQKRISSKIDNTSSFKNADAYTKAPQKKSGIKVNPASVSVSKQPPPTQQTPKFDEDALTAFEQRIREKIMKEMEEKFGKLQGKANQPEKPAVKKVPEPPKQPIKKEHSAQIPNKASINSKNDVDRTLLMKKQMMEQKKQMMEQKKQMMEQRKQLQRLPEKKAFHKNPYLDPPRRLLEPQRPPKLPIKRRIESDDEDDDDMSDFIDDSTSQNEENYSQYIKELFGYDKSRYIDEDDDDIMETSFAEQMKEEVRSAKLGYLEDLEEERKEMERKKKKKLKK